MTSDPPDVYDAISKQIWLARESWHNRHFAKPPRIVTHISWEMWELLVASPCPQMIKACEPSKDFTGGPVTFAGSTMIRVNSPGMWAVTRVEKGGGP